MYKRQTQAHDDYAHWIARLSRIGQDLSDFQRNTQWMLSAYFEGLPSCKRENYIDAYGRFKDGIGKAKLVDIDEESDPVSYTHLFLILCLLRRKIYGYIVECRLKNMSKNHIISLQIFLQT